MKNFDKFNSFETIIAFKRMKMEKNSYQLVADPGGFVNL